MGQRLKSSDKYLGMLKQSGSRNNFKIGATCILCHLETLFMFFAYFKKAAAYNPTKNCGVTD